MASVLQVWAAPCPDLTAELQLSSGVSIKAVLVEAPSCPPFDALLLQMQASSANLDNSLDLDFRRIGQVLSRLSFSLLCQFHVFSARLIPMGLNEGDPVESWVFPGAPGGIALFESKLAYSKSAHLDPAFIVGPLSSEVESAISWFTIGNLASNSVQQVLCHWIGLESLAPTIQGPWQCSECRGEVPECPHCQEPTTGPKTVRSIRDYLEGSLGVERKEYKLLYDLRCKISHGGLAMDPEGIIRASAKAFRIQELLLQGIKNALGWPLELAPLIQPAPLTLVGVPAFCSRTTVQGARFYDQPVCTQVSPVGRMGG